MKNDELIVLKGVSNDEAPFLWYTEIQSFYLILKETRL